jgi:hypothetical protein
MEALQIKKFISAAGVILEVGDFYGSSDDESISSMEEEGTNLRIYTTGSYYDLTLKPGDFLVDTTGSSKLVKSKFDKDE